MLGSLPPYALVAPVFRFPALAALVGRRPLGGDREVALVAFLCAHVVAGVLPGSLLTGDGRARRAAGARAWIGAVALPAVARAPFIRLIDATGRGDVAAVRQALSGVLETVGRTLDAPSRRELERLEEGLEGA